ncbi:MAG: aminoacyl-tRNA hydrolase [Candidatus Omnitrophica bacterium]|nr:aminoacyl-tRNA hydrolase [Candidatus Omnitrophota bacterium]
MKLIVGLGNPGSSLRNSRHNAGFLVVEELARDYNIKFKVSFRLKAQVAQSQTGTERIILAKPFCFMNRSGQSVKLLLEKFDLSFSSLLIICDDLNLPWAKLRLRKSGRSGGHKGLDSIIKTLKSREFARLRLGIDRPKQTAERLVTDYVLGKWSRQEKKELMPLIEKAAACCRAWVFFGIAEAMNRFN